MTGIDERNLEHIFYNGLKPEMQEVIKMKEPKGLTEHITAVVGMEGSAFCRSVSTTVQDSHYYKGSTGGTHKTWSSEGTKTQGGFEIGSTSGTAFRPRQKYTDAELDKMRRDGICFKCKGPYVKPHTCPMKELQILMVINGFEVEILDKGVFDGEWTEMEQSCR